MPSSAIFPPWNAAMLLLMGLPPRHHRCLIRGITLSSRSLGKLETVHVNVAAEGLETNQSELSVELASANQKREYATSRRSAWEASEPM